MCGDVQPELLRLLLLHADVARARAVVADEDRAEPRRVPVRDQLLDARLEVREHRLGDRGARASSWLPSGHLSRSSSVQEVPFAGEHHREAELVGALDDLLVAASQPPGWITTATPAAAAASMPSGNG